LAEAVDMRWENYFGIKYLRFDLKRVGKDDRERKAIRGELDATGSVLMRFWMSFLEEF
jgi:hypothetical protein